MEQEVEDAGDAVRDNIRSESLTLPNVLVYLKLRGWQHLYRESTRILARARNLPSVTLAESKEMVGILRRERSGNKLKNKLFRREVRRGQRLVRKQTHEQAAESHGGATRTHTHYTLLLNRTPTTTTGHDEKEQVCLVDTPEIEIRARSTAFVHQDELEIRVRNQQDDYLNWFLRSRFDTTVAELFPNVKEITESAAAIFWCRPYVMPVLPTTDTAKTARRQITIGVGDGMAPSTATLFRAAFPHVETVLSVDPALHFRYLPKHADVVCHCCKIEDCPLPESWRAEMCDVVVLAVHSHALLERYVEKLCGQFGTGSRFCFVCIPCCFPQMLDAPTLERLDLVALPAERDFNIHSPKRTVLRYISRAFLDVPQSSSHQESSVNS